jgi:hypothetical protein
VVNQSDPSGLYVHGYCVGGSALAIEVVGASANPSAFACALVDEAGNTALAWSNQLGLTVNDPSSALADFFGNGETLASAAVQIADIGLPLAAVSEAGGSWKELGAAVGIGKWLSVGGDTVQVDGQHWGLMVTFGAGASVPALPASVSWGTTEMHEKIYGRAQCGVSAQAIDRTIEVTNDDTELNSNSRPYYEAVQWINETHGNPLGATAGGVGTPIMPISLF